MVLVKTRSLVSWALVDSRVNVRVCVGVRSFVIAVFPLYEFFLIVWGVGGACPY